MDVTVRANSQVRHPYVQENSSETDEAVDFRALISGFESQAGGLGDVNAFTKPTQELTSGMAQYDHESLRSAEGDTIRSGGGSHGEDRQREDDVQTASKLLSEKGTRKDPGSSSKRERVVVPTEADLGDSAHNISTDEQVEAIQQAQVFIQANEAAENVDAVDANEIATAVVQHMVDLAPEEKFEAKLKHQMMQRSSTKPSASQDLNQLKTIGSPSGESITNAVRLKAADAQASLESKSLVDMPLSADGKLLEAGQMEGDFLTDDLEVLRPEASLNRPSKILTSQNSDSASQEWSNLMTGSSMSAGVEKMTADTVKLSAKGRTVGTLMGGLSGTAKKTETASRELNSVRTRTPVLPEHELDDVDKLSVISQISDGLKLKFGGDQTLEVNLNPAELGRVRLQLEMQGDKTVNIKVSAEHAVIADLLNLNLNDLRKDLLAQGVQINQIEVDVDAHGQGFEQQDQQSEEPEEHVDEQHAQELRGNDDNRRLSVTA